MTQIVPEQLLQSSEEARCNREISSREFPEHHSYPSVHLATHLSEQNHLLCATSTTLRGLF